VFYTSLEQGVLPLNEKPRGLPVDFYFLIKAVWNFFNIKSRVIIDANMTFFVKKSLFVKNMRFCWFFAVK
jgi:hypothetical protein